MNTEILNQIDLAIKVSPVSEPFEYVPEYNEEEVLSRNEIEFRQKCTFNKARLETQGQVIFKTETGSFKVLNDKEHLNKFRKKIKENWKAKNISPIKKKPLPSKISCVLNLILDLEHHDDDTKGYAENIYSAHKLTGLVFFGVGKLIIPWAIMANMIINDREMLIVKNCNGWNIIDIKTACLVTKVSGVDKKVFKNKNTTINHAVKCCKDFDFNIDRIKELELTNSQFNLEKRYCEENNIEIQDMSFL